MQDITNNINNIGKYKEQQRFQVSLSYMELSIIKALAQNPNDNYQDNSELMNFAESIFNDASIILDNVKERAN